VKLESACDQWDEIIHMKSSDRCATDRSAALDLGGGLKDEVFLPELLKRAKDRRELTG
jgi:hypothetical protein